jgi:hypothetical protein
MKIEEANESYMLSMKVNENINIVDGKNCLNFIITRVIGGWIYTYGNLNNFHSIFVPMV